MVGIKNNDDQLYEETSHAANTELVYGLVPGQETDIANVMQPIIDRIQREVKDLRDNGLSIQFNGQERKFKPVFHICQLDQKMRKMLLGLGGAFCTCCKVCIRCPKFEI